MSVSVFRCGSISKCEDLRWRGESSWRIISIATLLYAFSLFTVLPCLIMFKQHCTGLWQRREPSCASLTRLDGSQTHDIIPSDENQPASNVVLFAIKGWFSLSLRCLDPRTQISFVRGTRTPECFESSSRRIIECKGPSAAWRLFHRSESSHCAASPSGDDGGWTQGQLPETKYPLKRSSVVIAKIKIKLS